MSEEFRTRWAAHDVRHPPNGTKRFHHPVVGELELGYCTLVLPAEPTPTCALTIYTAEPRSASADGLALLASWATTGPAASLAEAGTTPATDRP